MCVGVIIGAHRIMGDVKIKPFIEDFSVLKADTSLMTHEGTTFTLKKIKTVGQGKKAFNLAEVTDRNQAETLKGTELYAPREMFPKEELFADVVETLVYGVDGQEIGHVHTIFDNGAHPVLEVARPDEESALIPYTDDHAKSSKKGITLTDVGMLFLDL